MDSPGINHHKEVFTSDEDINLADRLKDISQDRLIEEVIALWDEINKMEIELAASRRRFRSMELKNYSNNDSGRPLIAELEEKIRVVNTRNLQLKNQLGNERVRNNDFESDRNKIKILEAKNTKLLQNEEELLMLILDMEIHMDKLSKSIE
ncbi:MAG: hypothetical protein HOJ64_04315 [Euryarchaeota archaeon]|jgi:hypothetical protein|nr:hypothetical protein [Euryarchaeota archaeon]MBT5614078.1 hypothetical protein [Euryarchaeota archaeon]MBT6684259.1 hypothetical protein [Euryarchaeota archaeon]MBT6874276.1 hypothetical protein [Euryarchaeota archaeon]MBT7412956.1 hypothetical protein [Euryarchaeota archaeon]